MLLIKKVPVAELMWQFQDATLAELYAAYQRHQGKKVSQSIIHRSLKKLSLRRKNKSLSAKEQEREDIKKVRSVYE